MSMTPEVQSAFRAAVHEIDGINALRVRCLEVENEALKRTLKRLSLAAQTTGGVAGPDSGLMAAIAEAETILIGCPPSKPSESSGEPHA